MATDTGDVSPVPKKSGRKKNNKASELYSYLQGALVVCDATEQCLYTIGHCIYMFLLLLVSAAVTLY